VLEAAIFYWLSRREIEPAGAQRVARSAQTNLVEILLSAPDVGEDADFERVRDLGCPGIEGDT